MNLIEEYENWMETGQLPKAGLFNCLRGTKYKDTLCLFRPSSKDCAELFRDSIDLTYWASGLAYDDKYNSRDYSFTSLRQIIVLLILAIHDEL